MIPVIIILILKLTKRFNGRFISGHSLFIDIIFIFAALALKYNIGLAIMSSTFQNIFI
jgi:hypothetical protein